MSDVTCSVASRIHWRVSVIRACLRRILGRCCGMDPHSLRIVTGSRGKPSLSRPAGVRFNASHSGALLLVGVALDLEIGVDIEEIRPIDDVMLIADHHLSEAERLALRSLPAAGRTAAFYAAWTRKEAFVKATGTGLGGDFHAFDVTLLPDEPARLTALRGRWSAERVDAWRIHAFRPRAGFVAAVAARTRTSRLRWMSAASVPLLFPSAEERPA